MLPLDVVSPNHTINDLEKLTSQLTMLKQAGAGAPSPERDPPRPPRGVPGPVAKRD